MIQNVKAIDMHMHLNHGSPWDQIVPEYKNLACTELSYLQEMARAANIEKQCCSTFASVLNRDCIEEENEFLFALCQREESLYQWVVVDPDNKATFRQAERMLENPKCVGLKIHPSYHGYTMAEQGDRLCGFAAEQKTVLLMHPESPASSVLHLADRYPDMTFVVAHLGSEAHVDVVEYARHGNVYVDTSGVASSRNRVLEYAVSRIGSEKILFGTDTYANGFQRGRIEYAMFGEAEKENILRNNAQRLLGI